LTESSCPFFLNIECLLASLVELGGSGPQPLAYSTNLPPPTPLRQLGVQLCSQISCGVVRLRLHHANQTILYDDRTAVEQISARNGMLLLFFFTRPAMSC
jgi:hypothetical protein